MITRLATICKGRQIIPSQVFNNTRRNLRSKIIFGQQSIGHYYLRRSTFTNLSSPPEPSHGRTLKLNNHSPHQTYFRSASSSSSRYRQTDKKFKLDSLPFSIPPADALSKFNRWARDEQHLNSFLLNPKSITLTAAYVPVWTFNVNIRFSSKGNNNDNRKIIPEPFASAYYSSPTKRKGPDDTIYLPGLSVYAGYTYRRSLVDPVHNTTLIYQGNRTVPFQSWMLRLEDDVAVFPDPWNAPQSRAYAVLKMELQMWARKDEDFENGTIGTEIVSCRRVYMPTYVVDYEVLGMEYKAFISGCDEGVEVSGTSHVAFEFFQKNNKGGTAWGMIGSNLFSKSVHLIRKAGGPTALLVMGQWVLNLTVRFLSHLTPLKLPLAGFGAVYGFQKIVRPWMDNRSANAEWERQRDHEAIMHHYEDSIKDDFTDVRGNARRYFEKNKYKILQALKGEGEEYYSEEDTSTKASWYQQWEDWARQQWEAEQQHQRTYQNQRQRSQQWSQRQEQKQQKQRPQQKSQEKEKKKEYYWDFDTNDPYAILGIRRGASKAEISQAFRKEMLKYHPDVSQGSKEDKTRATERSKLITDAYRKIKTANN